MIFFILDYFEWFLHVILASFSIQLTSIVNYIIEFFSSFPNDVCKAGTKNGTCYTQAECTERNGEESGSCASGFGVCCVCKYLIKKF